MLMIPSDPDMLLSYVNLKLRDYYSSLEAMCDDLDISAEEIEGKLRSGGYFYDSRKNQFVSRNEQA